ncbi:ABC transporter ATP-binding protein [Chelatococcus asaccharovorans]|uniref:Iron(III) transport system ATP-binding protein/putative spermidine/putrescine transport system ATP-binding protein n=1 Tax=Chelatococcus asaccharovorans TaxID=28210 RepID=A0A2V3UFF9_9HYPH|nr:ABC transporter ATP-binding protein [Chelatococcus asaccharovorans]MBS7703080.1 ABC transporter ATP-binding protein [Chelatococcus asaccharovorans]PXW57380.1 iron(III) transport system ATP-binding protein/putative spermidine/putrescine transport system ATP-binding protein [Chelatococcus asaccharovorans]
MSRVEVINLVKRFGAMRAVDDVSFDVPEGGITTMLGPSGCGKTTILRCIAGLETATSGDIVIGSRAVFSGGQDVVPVEARNLGMVFQSYAIWPHMTIAQNVAYGLKVRGYPREDIARRVRAALDLVRLPGYAERFPGQLSGGQMQRVVLARAIAYDPELLLLDEPLANLDAHLREEMRQELKRIQRETGMTMVAVTHDQSEALALSDQIMVMSSGRILQRGRPEEIFRHPRTAEVARFLGATNVLSAHRVDGCLVVAGVGAVPDEAQGTAADRAAILFRPSDIVLRPGDAEGGWPGRIVFAQFLGREVQYLIRCGDTELTAEVSGRGGVLEEGATVSVTVAPGALLVYPEAA